MISCWLLCIVQYSPPDPLLTATMCGVHVYCVSLSYRSVMSGSGAGGHLRPLSSPQFISPLLAIQTGNQQGAYIECFIWAES